MYRFIIPKQNIYDKLVWKESSELGIGIATSSTHTYVCARYRTYGNSPSDVPRCVGRLLPESEWPSDTEASDETAAESIETKTTSVIVNHGFVVDSITINGSRFGTSEGGNEATFELEDDEEVIYVGAQRVRDDFSRIYR